jgi:hypothetical protein
MSGRLPIFIALGHYEDGAQFALKQALAPLDAVLPADARARVSLHGPNVYEVRITRGTKELRLLVQRSEDIHATTWGARISTAPDGKWDLWIFHAIDGDWRTQTRLYRRQKRFTSSAANNDGGNFHATGPITAAQLQANFVQVANKVLRPKLPNGDPDLSAPLRCPWVLCGDNPEALTVPEYDPTAAEVTNDTEADPDSIWPRPPPAP